MRTKTFGATLLAATMLSGVLAAPIVANAQSPLDRASHHRQQTKNQWRNIAIGSGALSVLGLATHNNTLTFGGLAGGLYSLSRYEHDRKSQSRIDQARAGYFSKPYVYHNGHRYHRTIVRRNGQRYYQYHRG